MYLLPLQTDNVAPGASRIVPEGAQTEVLADDLMFTEGPVWNAGALYYTDIVGNQIIKWSPDGGNQVIMEPAGHPDGMTVDAEGRLLVAGWGARTVWRWEHDGSTRVLAAFDTTGAHNRATTVREWSPKLNSPNDIITSSTGVVYFTDPMGGLFNVAMCDFDVQKHLDYQGVYMLKNIERAPSPPGGRSPDPGEDGWELTLLGNDFENPNGLCFSPDESLLYINDTPRQHIRVFDVQPDGTLTSGRLFAETRGSEPGAPDGMKVDVEGNVYVTGPGGIHVFDPAGKLLLRLLMPGPPANFTFGDGDWRTMYVTARQYLYRVRLGITGLPLGPHNRLDALRQAGRG